jgi:CheY-like chemotaxis protein
MQALETQEELRKKANEILKGVDQMIKAGHLDQALKEISRAKEIDPNNAYIYAFEERIAFLRGEEQRKRSVEVARRQAEDAARRKLDEQIQRADEDRKRREEEARKRIEEERRKKAEDARRAEEQRLRSQASAPASASAPVDEKRKIEEDTKQRFAEDFKKAEEDNRKKAQAEAKAPQGAQRGGPNDPLSIFRSVLLLAWADGALTKEEEAQLGGLRASLSISPEDEKRLQREAQYASYAQAFKLAWTSGLTAKERSTVVNELRQKFHIPPQDQPKIESRVLAEIGPVLHQQTICIIEDEDAVRKLIVQVLEGSGFVVHAFSTSDEAFNVLRELSEKAAPDLIMSDINLDTSTMGGFSFYEKVRQLEHLYHVPFVFLSGLTDEGMIRYGKALGADDYLTKPFSNDLLLDTIKGKLKRFQKLRKN